MSRRTAIVDVPPNGLFVRRRMTKVLAGKPPVVRAKRLLDLPPIFFGQIAVRQSFHD
ncbi:MAG: hypothetical protein AAB402_03795 [Patescibacteria group bacterium]